MTLAPGLHAAAVAGMLEEMYGGGGAQLLWRPFGKTFALGAEGWEAWKRDPDRADGLALGGQRAFTGFLNAYYEIPDSDLTAQARIGRFLAGDFGGTLALVRRMDNGVTLSAALTQTGRAGTGTFGRRAHIYTGLAMTVPLDSVRYAPRHTAARFEFAPLGRDAGAALDNPLPLYDLTAPFSERQIVRHWGDIAAPPAP